MGVSISHELRIDGDQTWIRYEYSTRPLPEETSDQLNRRVLTVIQKAMKIGIEETVKFVREQGE